MHTKLMQIAKLLGLVLMGFAFGTVFGFREGMFAFYAIDAPAKGEISLMNLKSMEKQNLVPTKLILNNDIDQGIYYYTISQEQWWFPLFDMGIIGGAGASSNNLKYVGDLANYRKVNPDLKENPALFDQVPKGMEEYADEYHEMAVAHRDRLTQIKLAIEKYSTKQVESTVNQNCQNEDH